MTFDILDETTLARLGNIDVWVSVYWDEPYNTEGSFSLEVRPTPENLALLREGRWVVRTDAAVKIPMRICHRSNENEDANLVVTGYPATWIYTKRVSASAVKNEAAEAAMRLMEAFFERRTYLKKYVVALRVMACPIQKIKGRSRWQVTLQIVDQPICQEAVGKMCEIAAAPAAGCLCVCQINPSSMM